MLSLSLSLNHLLTAFLSASLAFSPVVIYYATVPPPRSHPLPAQCQCIAKCYKKSSQKVLSIAAVKCDNGRDKASVTGSGSAE